MILQTFLLLHYFSPPLHSSPVNLNIVELDTDGEPIIDPEDVAAVGENESKSIDFLTKYGYLPRAEEGKSFLMTDDGVKNAIKQMQKYGGLNQTGIIDEKTLELMNSPRCGVPDVAESFENLIDVGDEDTDETNDEHGGYFPSRKKRYALQGSRWKKRVLSYKVGKYPTGLTRSEVDVDVRKAFKMWSDASGLRFVNKQFSAAPVDIEIRFENYYHGDEDSFDGPGGVVAHAFFPEFGGDAHFDNGENWTINKYSGVSLLQSVAHELGHSLGLLHSNNYRAMMSPYHKGWRPGLSLDSDDIRAVKALYGGGKEAQPLKKNTQRNYYYRY